MNELMDYLSNYTIETPLDLFWAFAAVTVLSWLVIKLLDWVISKIPEDD